MGKSLATQRLLRAMLEAPGEDHYGLELIKSTGLKSGTLYPILRRLEAGGLVVARWEENLDPRRARRPRRRLYRLTPEGMTAARTELTETVRLLRLDGGVFPAVHLA
jgi:DNA-binding PadR family transcriptional regulator